MAWKPIVAKSVLAQDFRAYVRSLSWSDWKPEFIVLHNTASPSLAQRPDGFTLQSIRNLEAYYRDDKGWPSGPHLFIDDKQIWVFTPLTTPGTHSPSWNRVAIGIEMLGNYDSESFTTGRGLAVRYNASVAIGELSKALGFKADAYRFHMADPKTTHDCPGKLARAQRVDFTKEVGMVMSGSTPPTIQMGSDIPGSEWKKFTAAISKVKG